jgi:thiol-disulfide isomerase/thioredoxin
MAGKMSKKTWLIVAILIIAVGSIVGIALSGNSSSPSDGTLPIITWNETTLSTLEGTPVVLNFWSISCYWCRQQLPYLENVAQQSGGEIKVIAVNIVDNAASVQNFFDDYRPTMIIALDKNGEAFADYCLAYNNTRGAIPFTLFVDSEGIVQYAKIGAFQSEAELWDTLNDVFGITIP